MKQRALTLAAALITVAAALVWALQGGDSTAPPLPAPAAGSGILAPEPTASPAATRADRDAGATVENVVSYAIGTAELQGLPSDLPPGSIVDLWVTWQPPVTKKAKVQRLLEGVRLERVAAPLIPDGPHVAVLAVPSEQISDLIWGDRFGALTVVVPPDPAE